MNDKREQSVRGLEAGREPSGGGEVISVGFGVWRGYDSLTLSSSKYEALLIPSQGSNLVRLYDKERGLDILRTPGQDEMEEFAVRPQVFGIPILFLPNRIKDGAFKFDGREYSLKINEPESHSHIHGFAHQRPWSVARAEAARDRAVVETIFAAGRHTDFYSQFPHEFEIRMTYTLSDSGLTQEIKVTNLSGLPMPLAVGQHTAFRASAGSLLRVGVGKRWELDAVFLATGKLLALTDEDLRLAGQGIPPLEKPLAAHYTASPFVYQAGAGPGREFHGAVLEDTRRRLTVVYETGRKYGHWVIWNENADRDFVCLEPQTCSINAANLKDTIPGTGFASIAPGETWAETTRVYAL
ncbi:MAG: aldose 1-epimerase [Clostridiales bacterium]|nr:aldose 1-epimerase [Clostridiales bacterium]